MDRRQILKRGAGLLAYAGGASWMSRLAQAAPSLPAGVASEQVLEALPGKIPLIKKSYRPPNYESPLSVLNEAFTPNNAFFVRYHLAGIPDDLEAASWRLKIGGPGAETPLELTLDDLKKNYEKLEFAAVCQCSGDRRGFSDPHVPGVEWGNGAIGNAKWAGVRLKDVLEKAGLKKEACEVEFNGADGPVLDATPDFVKSVPLWKAIDENTLIAYEMNGEPLPHWNGFPARMIVPGWTATYWMKHIVDIRVLTEPLKSFWMNPAYRVPKRVYPVIQHFTSQDTSDSPTTPITEIVVNSLVTNLENGAQVKAGQPVTVKGIAWDAGYGIAEVAVSLDDGKSWSGAELGPDLGRYSWRQWSYKFTPPKTGAVTLMPKARNNSGATQVDTLLFNSSGYYNNVIQKLALQAV